MLKVLTSMRYTMTPRAKADTQRVSPTLVSLINKVLAIGGYDRFITNYLSTVSSYNIKNDIWKGALPHLNQARWKASGCVLQATVYVFCGCNAYNLGGDLSSIEAISEKSLFLQSTGSWLLIEVP